ncbi:MAG: phosphoenolpyruvate carboxykinase (GTP) [Limnochordia bacterium]|jgi:phosphoenolpyruvate carboxykinase (GTP)
MSLEGANLQKLQELNNQHVVEIVNWAIDLCKPAKVTVFTDAKEDADYIKELAKKNGEEAPLKIQGHTVHFDGYYDQARDKENTKYLVSDVEGSGLGNEAKERKEGLEEIFSYLDGSMQGKEMLVLFYCLGPTNSKFSIPALQITDSAYVAHSENILYRPGYEEFKRLNGSKKFFHFIHSAGRLANGVSVDVDKRRIFIDLEANRVFTVNNQYAGNSVGLKKLALRLAIQKASREDWLAEHMFVMGAKGPNSRTTYFTGAFPSACGKTSTAMIPGGVIVGDDIAYLRAVDGQVRAVNVERGMFGIIEDVSEKNDPVIFDALTRPGEVIFSNVLVHDGTPYWGGMGIDIPDTGRNFSGEWYKGKKGPDGKEVPASHKNSRYTLRIDELSNSDSSLEDPKGVPVSGFIYGGRDSDTSVPVAESPSWGHGVMIGACLESETTAATLGQQGVRKHNPMANSDFLAISLGTYIRNYLDFGKRLDNPPTVYATNYFLRKDGKGSYLNGILDKKVWIMWMEGRVNGDFDAIETPIGRIPKYEDLKVLFKEHLNKDYTEEEYVEQFSIRVDKYIAKYDRMEAIFSKHDDVPAEFMDQIRKQKQLLEEAKAKYGAVVSPYRLV